MFAAIGRLVVRWRVPVVVGWTVLAAALALFPPSLAEVGTTDEASFLPRDAPSLRARELLRAEFPGQAAPGQAVVVVHRPEGLTDTDRAYVKGLTDALTGPAAPAHVTRARSAFTDPALAPSLVSPDGTTMLVRVDLDVPPFEEASRAAVGEIRDRLGAPPAGLAVHVTGQSAIFADLLTTIRASVDRTTVATVVLVVVLLLLIYWSPVAAAVPVATITVAFFVARGLLGLLAAAGWEVSSLLDSFLIVLVFGVGTDYCIFLISRLREETGRGAGDPAVVRTLGRIGEVLTASAATVVVGFLGLLVARFGLVQSMGPALALAVAVTLLVSLTLPPALASLLGPRLFWPFRPQAGEGGEPAWGRVARLVTARPWLTTATIVALFLLPYPQLRATQTSFDLLEQLPADRDAVQGFRVLTAHFGRGEALPLTVLVRDGAGLTDPEHLAALERLRRELAAVDGVAVARGLTAPTGDPATSPFLVRNQLAAIAAPGMADRSEAPAGVDAATVAALDRYLAELGAAYPAVTADPAYRDARAALAALGPGGPPPQDGLPATVRRLRADLSSLAGAFGPDDFLVSEALVATRPEPALLTSTFASPDGDAAQLVLVLAADPYAPEAFTTVRELRARAGGAATGPLSDAEAVVGGPSAEFADIQATVRADVFRVLPVLALGVGIVLALLLRSLVAPLYLLATVLLSFGTTLGLSTFLLQDLLGHPGLVYFIPLIVLVLLVALGADYNIFLMSRVREEAARSGTARGVVTAAARTGGIITAAGIILAGTFAALLLAPLQSLVQVGAAVALGILLDTFLVRGMLVPAVAKGLGRWNWWPGRVDQGPTDGSEGA